MQAFFRIFLAVLFFAFSAQITIDVPIIDIPITGQSLAILTIAGLYSWQYSTLAVLIYILLGICGLPVFAEATYGWSKIIGNSGGFLLGFIPAAFIVSYLMKNKYQFPAISPYLTKSYTYLFLYILSLMTLGTAIIIACGLARLSVTFGFEKALEYGFYPFFIGAIIKIILGALVVYFFEKNKTIFPKKYFTINN